MAGFDPMNAQNGQLRDASKPHRKPLRIHAVTDILGFSEGIGDFGTPEDREPDIAVTARPGDLLAHHAGAVHWAKANTHPTAHRRALGFIYYACSVQGNRNAYRIYQKKIRDKWRI